MKFTSFSRLIATSLSLFFALFLTACGQKGDLYLDKTPEKEKTALRAIHAQPPMALSSSINTFTI